jgi:hypothetical protein
MYVLSKCYKYFALFDYLKTREKLIDYSLFFIPLKTVDGDITIAGEGLQNLGLCSALRAFELGGIFIVPHLL